MIPIDRFEMWAPRLDECAGRYLSAAELREYRLIPAVERLRQLRDLLEKPIARFTAVNEAYFRARWAEAVAAVYEGEAPTLLEVATGDADMIPQMMARRYPGSRYITANMNRRLNRSLLEKTRGLAVNLQLIEGDAAEIGGYLPAESLDVIAFQHGVNDVIQAILCEREGVDTVETDWMEALPHMIAILQRETAQGTLEAHARGPFLGLLEELLKVLKEGGTIVMNHYQFQLDLDWGYPSGLFESLIPMVRGWVGELTGCEEVFRDGFHPQWWMFIKRE